MIKETNRFSHYLALLAIIIIGAALYYKTIIIGSFVFDDNGVIVKNEFIKNFSHIKEIFVTNLYHGSKEPSNFYRPLQMLSYILEYHFWKLNPFGYHLTSVIIHIFNAVLVYLLIYIISKKQVVAFVTALFICVHPIHSGAANYIAGRADSLSATFLITSFIFYILYVSNYFKGHGVLLFLGSFFCFCLAVLSKEVSCILPVLFIFYLFCFHSKNKASNYTRPRLVWLFFATIGAYAVFRFRILNFASENILESTVGSVPLYLRLLTTSKVLMIYFKILLFPVGLHMEWNIVPATSFFQDEVFLSIVGLIIIFIFMYYLSKTNKLKFFALGWFFIMLIPYLNIIPLNYFLVDGWLYTPSIGFFMLISMYFYELREKSRLWKILVNSVVILTVATYSFLTFKRSDVWADSVKLYNEILKYSPDNTKARLNMGLFLEEKGLYEDSIIKLLEVIKINPEDKKAHVNLGVIYLRNKSYDKALEEFKKASALDPGNYNLFNDIGLCYEKIGSLEKAKESYKMAQKLNPEHSLSYKNLAVVCFRNQMYDEALEAFEKAVILDPEDYVSHHDIGLCYKKKGNIEKALAAYKKALELNPNYSLAYYNIGNIYLEKSQYDKAIENYKKAVNLDSNNIVFHVTLGKAYKNNGMNKEAIESFEKVLKLNPANREATEGLSALK